MKQLKNFTSRFNHMIDEFDRNNQSMHQTETVAQDLICTIYDMYTQ